MESHFSSEVLWLFTVLSLINICTNLGSLVYVVKTFDLSKALFLLLFIDSLTCFGSGIIGFVNFWFSSSSALHCSLKALCLVTPFFVGNLSMMMVAIIRYFSIFKVKQPNNKLVMGFSVGALFLAWLVFTSLHLNYVLDNNYVMIGTQVCIRGNVKPILTMGQKALVTAPHFTPVVTSFIFDLLIIRKLKLMVTPQEEAETANSIMAVPIRATRVSVFVLVFMALAFIGIRIMTEFFGLFMEGAVFSIIAFLVVNTVRCPLVTLLTFKGHKKRLSELERAKAREELRMKEIRHAWKTRQAKANTEVNPVEHSLHM